MSRKKKREEKELAKLVLISTLMSLVASIISLFTALIEWLDK